MPACQVGRNPPVEIRKKKNLTAYLQHGRKTATCLPDPPAGRGTAPEAERAGMLWQPAWLKEVSERLERGSPPAPNLPLLLPLRQTYEQAHLGISAVAI